MSEFKGTIGKWSIYQRIDDNEENQYSVTSNNGKVCYCYNMSVSDYENNIARANALLISKAPEMLEMLKHHLSYLKSFENNIEDADFLEYLIFKTSELIKQATEI